MSSSEPTLASLRRDRLLIWLWVPGGVAAFVALTRAWQALLGDPPRAFVDGLCVVWILSVFALIWRHSSRRCPDCGHRYLRAYPWMPLDKVRCQACGYELE